LKIAPEIFSDDLKLVKLAKGDKRAFSLLYEKYFEKIFLFIFKRVQDEAASGDICQETMLKAMFNIDKYEDRGVPFSAWIYRIASNEVNLYFRKSAKVKTVEIQEKHVKEILIEISVHDLSDEEEQERLIKALNSLEPEQSEIIDLRFFMGYSFKEIAEFYGITEPNAKMRVYRILERLKKGWDAK
jgi:RNA polymerase sigma-70 factor (ECF subfamily)